jgi:hypothetical protein
LALPDFRQFIRGWRREIDGVGAVYTFLGAFMRQQAADARAERKADPIRCSICGGEILHQWERLILCPQCEAIYCSACFAWADKRGDVSCDGEYFADSAFPLESIHWHRCQKCGEIRAEREAEGR